jgi:hypothetical protein
VTCSSSSATCRSSTSCGDDRPAGQRGTRSLTLQAPGHRRSLRVNASGFGSSARPGSPHGRRHPPRHVPPGRRAARGELVLHELSRRASAGPRGPFVAEEAAAGDVAPDRLAAAVWWLRGPPRGPRRFPPGWRGWVREGGSRAGRCRAARRAGRGPRRPQAPQVFRQVFQSRTEVRSTTTTPPHPAEDGTKDLVRLVISPSSGSARR